MWLGHQVAAGAIYMSYRIGQIKLIQNLLALLAAILYFSATATPIQPFGAARSLCIRSIVPC